jgi:hypothetical protein
MEAQARQRGDRENLAAVRVGSVAALAELGRWREALARAAEADELHASPWARAEAIAAVPIFCEQAHLDAAQALLQEQGWQRHGEQAEMAAYFAGIEARLLRAQNRPAEALDAAERGLLNRDKLGDAEKGIKRCLAEALEAALTLDELGKADELLATIETLRPGQLTPTLEGQCARFRARLDARRGDHANVESDYQTAVRTFAEHGLVFHHAATQTEYAEWLTGQGRPDEADPLLAEARETFEGLEATPWLERLAVDEAAAPEKMPA